VQQLNQVLVNKFLNVGVPATGVSPFSHMIGDVLDDKFYELVSRCHSLGIIPILHGDVVYTTKWVVMSGDTLIEIISKKVNSVDRCLFVTDVHGIYTKPPTKEEDETGRGLISEILIDAENKLKIETSSVDHDVTGGIETKIKSYLTRTSHL
jgi:isopentenyl phosphate kinase